MQITTSKYLTTKYVDLYLSPEEYESKEIKEKIYEYRLKKYNVAVFISGNEDYPNALKNIVIKEAELINNEM